MGCLLRQRKSRPETRPFSSLAITIHGHSSKKKPSTSGFVSGFGWNFNVACKTNECVLVARTFFPGKERTGRKHLLQDEKFFFAPGSGEIYLRHSDERQSELQKIISPKYLIFFNGMARCELTTLASRRHFSPVFASSRTPQIT